MECDDFCPDILENDCNRDIILCLLKTQYALFEVDAHIVRRNNINKGNFFDEYIEEDRSYIPIKISFSKMRDEGTKDDKDTIQKSESLEIIYMGDEKILRTDLIIYKGGYYDCRDLFTQEWNGGWLFQKFNMVYIQDANDVPDNVLSS